MSVDLVAARARKRWREQRWRDFRRQLGLCRLCREPALRGYTHCGKHITENRQRKRLARARQAAARGWLMMRVPFRGGVVR